MKYSTSAPNSFELDEKALRQIADATKRLLCQAAGSSATVDGCFNVRYRGDDKPLQKNLLEDVLSASNDDSNPILTVEYNAWCSAEAADQRYHVTVRFHSRWDGFASISITADGPDDIWCKRIGSELKDLSLAHYAPKGLGYSLARKLRELYEGRTIAVRSALYVAIPLLLLITTYALFFGAPLALSQQQAQELRLLAANASSDSEKIDFVYKLSSASLGIQWSHLEALRQFLTSRSTYEVVIPLAALLAATWLAVRCCTTSHFVWGAGVGRHTRTQRIRDRCETGVLLAFVVGVLVNVLSPYV